MKQIKIFFLGCIIALSANAQEYTHSLEGVEWVKIESRANVTVKTHSSKELLIKGGSHSGIPDRAKGLKLVGENGTDNTDVGYYVIKEGNNLIVRNLKKSERSEIYLPASQNISVITNWHGDIEIIGFLGEIEASARLNGSVRVEDVSGPLTANTLNGTIDVVFSKVSQSSPITVYSTNGALDITVPTSTPADISLGSTNGEIYTNFELSVPDKGGLKSISSKRVKGVINKGGVKIELKTTNGNIYLRKK